MPDLRTNRRPSADRGSYSGDDGGSHFLNWIGIGNSASDSSGHSGGATEAVIMPPAAKKIGTLVCRNNGF